MIQARVEHAVAADRGLSRAVEQDLAAVGVTLATDRRGLPAPPVVLVLSSVTSAVLDAVRETHTAGQRLLAILPGGDERHPDDAWRLLSAGAADVIAWNPPVRPAASIAARLERWANVDEAMASSVVRDNLVGASPVWRAVVREIVEAALFTDNAVLVTGESGTGKELVARLVHTLDRRHRKGELIVLDCTTVVPTLSGSEFFGHERGAFTGAVTARDGAFGQADGGTLFLDEIGDLPLPLQAELLRVIQEGTYKRVGSDTWRTTRFRLVSATNRPLAAAMGAGAFRADLYHRIAAWTFELPPLRERPGDVALLARHFLAELQPGGDPPALDPAVERHLAARPYPGNVRELRLLMGRIAARHVGPGPITLGDLPTAERAIGNGGVSTTVDQLVRGADGAFAGTADRASGASWRDALAVGVGQAVDAGIGLETLGRLAKDLAVERALEAERRDTSRTARRLGITERAVQARLAASRRDAAPGMHEDPGEPDDA